MGLEFGNWMKRTKKAIVGPDLSDEPMPGQREKLASLSKAAAVIGTALVAPQILHGTAAKAGERSALGEMQDQLADMQGSLPIEALQNGEANYYVEIPYEEIERVLLAKYPRAKEFGMQRTTTTILSALAMDKSWGAQVQLRENESQKIEELSTSENANLIFIKYTDDPTHVYQNKFGGRWWGDVPGVLVGNYKITSVFVNIKELWRLLDKQDAAKK